MVVLYRQVHQVRWEHVCLDGLTKNIVDWFGVREKYYSLADKTNTTKQTDLR